MPFEAGEVCCQKTTPSFVDFVWETMGPMLAGVPALVLADEVVKDPRLLVARLDEGGVSDVIQDVAAQLEQAGKPLNEDQVEAIAAKLTGSELAAAEQELALLSVDAWKLFIIFIATINFMNLITARASHRWKEVGVRKTIGALKSQLFAQFVVEAGFLGFLAFALALIIGVLVGTYSSIYVASASALALGISRQDLLLPEKEEAENARP